MSDDMTYEDAAELLGVSPRTVRAMACPGGLIEHRGDGLVSKTSVELYRSGLLIERRPFRATVKEQDQ